MGRSTGPKHHMCRRVGERLCNTDKCPLVKRNYPPGVHGVKGRSKLTGYGLQLREKQKARWVYGIRERQFRNYYETAISHKGATDVVLLQLLESRLDNLVFRLGLAKTRAAARQLVNHGHILVNDKKVDIPSYQVKVGQIIAVDKSSSSKSYFKELEKNWAQVMVQYDWLARAAKEFTGQLLALPNPEQIQQPFDIKLIVEFYSR
ncbi:MAG: 30S ribosomal protein S4 [Candidatus Kerfeldbacteria bacterium]|nr:30S ribosomal protein S4 [Candidatus Kerfeldbacteria bacterium]